MVKNWINDNYVIVDGIDDEKVIDWGNGIFTPVGSFVVMFEDVIQTALDNGEDVKQAIRDADNGRGFASLI